MRCPNCGQMLADDTLVCPSCGTSLENIVEQSVEENLNDESYKVYDTASAQPEKPMRWYKFLIYISLFLSSLSSMYSGLSMVMGMEYGSKVDTAEMYAQYGGLRAINLIYGVILLGIGVYAFIVRQKLVQYRQDAPAHLIRLYVITLAAGLLHLLGETIVYGQNIVTIYTVYQVAFNIIMILANKVYFDKRQHMFKN